MYRAHNVTGHGFQLVVFAPIDIRPPRDAGAVEDVGWAHAAQLVQDEGAGFEARGCAVDCGFLGMGFEEAEEVGGYPAVGAPDEVDGRWGGGWVGDAVFCCALAKEGVLSGVIAKDAVLGGVYARHRCGYCKEIEGSCPDGEYGIGMVMLFGQGIWGKGVRVLHSMF